MATAPGPLTSTRKGPAVGPGEVHLHLLWGVEDRDPPAPWISFLPEEEKVEALGMASGSRRREFLWSRLLLRRLLVSYLGERGRTLPLRKSPRGKPFLKDGGLHFNLSHTQGLIAFSFARGPVGIDVQRTEEGPKALGRAQLVARRYFSRPEIDHLEDRTMAERPFVFTRIFSLKEAYAKALGEGLALPGKSFTVPLSLNGAEGRGGWQYLSRTLKDGGHCLSHATRSKRPLRYRWSHWKGSSLAPDRK